MGTRALYVGDIQMEWEYFELMKFPRNLPPRSTLGHGLSATAKHLSNAISIQSRKSIKNLDIFDGVDVVVVSDRDDCKIRVLKSCTNQGVVRRGQSGYVGLTISLWYPPPSFKRPDAL